MNKGKKADIVLPEVLKMILAGIGIILLLYLAYSMYSLLTKKTEIEQARESLKQIIALASSLKDEESKDYLVLGANGWMIKSKNCNNANCLCICPGSSLAGNNCDSEGICQNSEIIVNSACTISTSGAPVPSIETGCIYIEGITRSIKVYSQKNAIYIGTSLANIENSREFEDFYLAKKELISKFISTGEGKDDIENAVKAFFKIKEDTDSCFGWKVLIYNKEKYEKNNLDFLFSISSVSLVHHGVPINYRFGGEVSTNKKDIDINGKNYIFEIIQGEVDGCVKND
jgi:hypothetical protein